MFSGREVVNDTMSGSMRTTWPSMPREYSPRSMASFTLSAGRLLSMTAILADHWRYTFPMALGLGTTSSLSSCQVCPAGTYSTSFTFAWDSRTSSIGRSSSSVSWARGWMMMRLSGQRSLTFFFCLSLVISSTSSCIVLMDASRRSSIAVGSETGQSHMWTDASRPSMAW